MSETSLSRVSKLLKVLDLKQIEENLYQGRTKPKTAAVYSGAGIGASVCCRVSNGGQGAFALLHAYFLRPGRVDLPSFMRLNGCGMADPLRRAG